MTIPRSASLWLIGAIVALVVASSVVNSLPRRAQQVVAKVQDTQQAVAKAEEKPGTPALPVEQDVFAITDSKPADPASSMLASIPRFNVSAVEPAVRGEVGSRLSLDPIPPAAFPDDPPPHEGALYDLPYIIEPPDLLTVEVLEALPGRPIQGDHLVRPDGTVNLGFYGEIYVRGLTLPQAKAKIVLHLRNWLSDEILGLENVDVESGKTFQIDPADTDRVFVDISAYNSKVYHIQGDVAAPGQLPVTGNETVLNAIIYAGGLSDTADPRNIRLVRAPRGGKPAKVFKIDWEAIRDRGEAKANLQLLPGDRLVVGRDETVQKTVAFSRKAALLNSALNNLLTSSFGIRTLGSLDLPSNATSSTSKPSPDAKNAEADASRALTPAEIALRNARMRDAVDLFWKLSQPSGETITEQEFKAALLRLIETQPPKP